MLEEKVSRREFLKASAGAAVGASLAAASFSRALGANGRVGVGFIGCGGRGLAHISYVSQLNKAGEPVEIVAVSDLYRRRLDAAARSSGAKSYMDHRELLADPKVDVVCIATPDHLHGYQVIDAVRAGKDVYCEKPITHWRQFELTKRMAQEVKKSKRIVQVGTQGMSDSAWHQAAELVKQGAIGQPIHAECGYFRIGDWGERGMPVDDPDAKPGPDLNWEGFLGDSPKSAFSVSRFFRWRMYWDYAGGPSTDLFPHSLTPVVKVLGVTFPAMVVATGGKFRYEEREVPDTFNMLVDYPEKITVAVLGTQGNDYPGTGNRSSPGRCPVIRGWEGTITFEGDKIVVRPQPGVEKPVKEITIEHGESMLDHWRNFLTCCRTREKPWSPIEELGYHVQTALQMGVLSLREGKVARFDREREEIVLGTPA
jgi:predicted dehydrogenase